jgi:hypothetical protein
MPENNNTAKDIIDQSNNNDTDNKALYTSDAIVAILKSM